MAEYSLGARLYDPVMEPLVARFRESGLDLAPAVPGMRVVDLGCGTGAHLDLYRSRGAQVTGVDRSAAMLQRARAKLGPEAALFESDAAATALPGGEFDLVLIMTVLHELQPASAIGILREAERLAGREGRILVVDHHLGCPAGWRGHLIRWFTGAIEGIARHDARGFLRSGGVPVLAARTGLVIETWRSEAAGTMGLYLLRGRV